MTILVLGDDSGKKWKDSMHKFFMEIKIFISIWNLLWNPEMLKPI